MIYIDSQYDIILTYSPIIEITGHIFECFDYYLFLRQYYKVGILFFSSLSYQKLEIAWNSKYNVDFADIKDDLILTSSPTHTGLKTLYKFGSNTKVILTDGNYAALDYYNIILVAKKIFAFKCQDFSNTPPIFHKQLIYLQDNRIYQQKDKYFSTIHYIKKLPFKFYKKSFRSPGNVGMMYTTYVCRKITPDIIQSYHIKSKCDHSLLIVPYSLPEYNNIPNITQIVAPVENLFDKFDTYIYTPVNRKFDCSPRLITECFMHNKKVYKELDYYDIGLETRYNDCINNLELLNLTDNDDILTILNI